jgi:hypothetical protein
VTRTVQEGCIDDEPYFVFALNREIDPRWTAPPPPRYPEREVITMLTRRTIIEFPDGETTGPIDRAIIRSPELEAVLRRHEVERLARTYPCFDLADTLCVGRLGDTVRCTDLSLFWNFRVPAGGDPDRLVEDLGSLPVVVFAERNGQPVPNSDDFEEVRFEFTNPFVPNGTLGVYTARNHPASIELFDARGRRVHHLTNAQQESGWRRFAWDGTDDAGEPLPGGVYFGRATAGGKTVTRKLVLLR